MLNRTIDDEGRLITKRLHVIYQRLPHFITVLFGNITVYGGEETIVDPKNRTLTVRSKNLSFTKQAAALDLSVYKQDPENASKTSFFKQTTTFARTSVIGSSQIERWYAYNEGHHHTKTVNVINEILSGKLQPDYSIPEEHGDRKSTKKKGM